MTQNTEEQLNKLIRNEELLQKLTKDLNEHKQKKSDKESSNTYQAWKQSPEHRTWQQRESQILRDLRAVTREIGDLSPNEMNIRTNTKQRLVHFLEILQNKKDRLKNSYDLGDEMNQKRTARLLLMPEGTPIDPSKSKDANKDSYWKKAAETVCLATAAVLISYGISRKM